MTKLVKRSIWVVVYPHREGELKYTAFTNEAAAKALLSSNAMRS